MVEHRADNAGVSGSIPDGPINETYVFQAIGAEKRLVELILSATKDLILCRRALRLCNLSADEK